MKKKKKLRILLAAFFTGCILCTGCGENEIALGVESADTIAIDENGSVLYDMTGYFDQSYYDITQLVEMARSEAAEYSVSNIEGGVSLDAYGKRDSDGFVNLTYHCTSSSVFADCFDAKLFYGSVAEAVSKGYSLNGVSFVKVSDGSVMSGSDIMTKYPDNHVIITDFEGIIEGPYMALYTTNGCLRKVSSSNSKTEYIDTRNESGSEDLEENEETSKKELHFILLKK